MSQKTANELADAIDDSHDSEWAGAAIADALVRALRRMSLDPEQTKILTEELTVPNPDLDFQRAKKPTNRPT